MLILVLQRSLWTVDSQSAILYHVSPHTACSDKNKIKLDKEKIQLDIGATSCNVL
jgi:hypothetical protein